jgi:hypothetical protein
MDDRGFILDSDATAQDVYSTLHVNEIRTLLLAPGTKESPVVGEMQVLSSPQAGQIHAHFLQRVQLCNHRISARCAGSSTIS